MKLLIKAGRIIDPLNKRDALGDILIIDGQIQQIAPAINTPADETINAQGLLVLPGLVDMHVHLREPGREDKETVATATAAALKGGITTVLAMPNTYPAIDCVENTILLKGIIKQSGKITVLIAAAITKGRRGQELSEIAKLKKQGVAAITDDGESVDDSSLMLKALQQAGQNGILTICHCEDKALSRGGVVNLGLTSTCMGLRGISRESEYKRVERDVELARIAQARIHLAHISCRESVEIIARAKKKGLALTCETAPHYFALADEAVRGFDTNMKMNPPLRSSDDVAAIKQALGDGTIDAIASDHAPHTENEKDIEFDRAAFGTVGLETALAVGITELVDKGILDWGGLIAKMALNPARILGIDKGNLSPGSSADLIIVSPQKEWIVEKSTFLSKSQNSAFLGRKLKGVVEYTIFQGQLAYRRKA